MLGGRIDSVEKSIFDGAHGYIGTDLSSIRITTQLGGEEKITKPYWQHPWIHAVLSKKAEMMASARLKLLRDRSPDADPVDDADILYRFFERPHPSLSYGRFMRLLSIWDDLWGDLVLAFRVGDRGNWVLKPPPNLEALIRAPDREDRLQLWPLKPDAVDLMVDQQMVPQHWRFNERERGEIQIPLEAVVHIFTPEPYDPYMRRGVGRAVAGMRTANLDWQAERYTDADMRTGGVPTVVITAEKRVTPEQRQEIAKQYDEKHGRPQNNGKALVLESGMTAAFPSKTAKEMAWAEVRQWNRDTLIALLGLNKAVLGMTDDDTRANAQEGRRSAYQDTIIPSLERFAAELENEFLSKLPEPYASYGIKFDLSHIEALRGDAAEQWTTAKTIFDTFPGMTLATTATLLDIEIPEGVPADETKPEPEPVMAPGGATAKAFDVMELPTFRRVAARVFSETVEQAERAIKKRTASVFKGYVKKALTLARDLAQEAGAPVVERDFSPDQPEAILPLTESWKALLAEQVMPIERRLYLAQSRLIAEALGVEPALALGDPVALAFLEGKEIALKETVETLREAVKDAIRRSLIEDGGVGTLADQIRNALERYETELEIMQSRLGERAERIARTESTSVANGARFEEAKAQGVEEMRWITARDAQVRHEHAELDGRVAKLGEEFGHGLRYPGDPQAGSASLVVNCRCSITPTARGVGSRDKSLNGWHRAVYGDLTT